jgi:hypothetical protein
MATMDWIAAFALGLSAFSIWLQYGFRSRADLIVRFEQRAPHSPGHGAPDRYVVIYNSGAADAREVKIRLSRDDGKTFRSNFVRTGSFP